MTDQLQRMMKKLEDDGPIEKHILLLKLTEALENAPEFGDKAVFDPANTANNGVKSTIDPCKIKCYMQTMGSSLLLTHVR